MEKTDAGQNLRFNKPYFMYSYLYDNFTNDRKYGRLLHKIEKRLTDLNLNGRIVRLGISKNIKIAVDDEIRRGTKTIIAVGNDTTVAQIINAVATNHSDDKNQITIGIIPIVEKNNKIATALGIKSISSACEILLARRLKTFQLTKINQDYFLFKAVLNAADLILEIDKNYIVHNVKPVTVEITNSPVWPEDNPAEKKLKLRVYNKEGESLFFLKEVLIVNKDISASIDGSLEVKTPARIKLSDEKIRIIVGKERAV